MTIPPFSLNTRAGQHILIDTDVLSLMVSSAAVPPEEPIIEPGAGTGILTAALASDKQEKKGGAPIIAVERDKRLIPYLRNATKQYPSVRIVAGDILATDPAEFSITNPYRLVGNIPYSISARLLRHVLAWNPPPTRITALIDNEVAKRATSSPPNANILSVSVGIFAEARVLHGNISPEAFHPPPKVRSAILQLVPHKIPLIPASEQKDVFRLIRAGFANRRKMIRNSMGALWQTPPNTAASILTNAGIDPSRRPQTLTIQEWAKIAHTAPNTHTNNAPS